MKHNKIPSWAPHGAALKAYRGGNTSAKISILMDDGSVTKMPIEIYFRTEEEFPEIETIALDLCKGSVLDVGAGAGAHSLVLQKKGLKVTALDIVPEADEIMKELGVKNTVCADFLHYQSTEKFDTLLFLMNGIGIAENLNGLKNYLNHAHKLTHQFSQIILDSSDLRNGEIELDIFADYFGEIEYRLAFEGLEGAKYSWLYVDQEKLIEIAEECGWNCTVIYEQEDGGYLAQLNKKLD